MPGRERTGPKGPPAERGQDRQHALQRCLVVGAGHDRQRPVDRSRDATRDRCVDERDRPLDELPTELAGVVRTRRAHVDDNRAVRQRIGDPVAQHRVLHDAAVWKHGDDRTRGRERARVAARHRASLLGEPQLNVAICVPDHKCVAGPSQVRGHWPAHPPEADETDRLSASSVSIRAHAPPPPRQVLGWFDPVLVRRSGIGASVSAAAPASASICSRCLAGRAATDTQAPLTRVEPLHAARRCGPRRGRDHEEVPGHRDCPRRRYLVRDSDRGDAVRHQPEAGRADLGHQRVWIAGGRSAVVGAGLSVEHDDAQRGLAVLGLQQ